MSRIIDIDERLHATDLERLEQEIVELSLFAGGAVNGGLFLWSEAHQALEISFHIVRGIRVDLPKALLRKRTDGRPNGIALQAWEANRPYNCADSRHDPNYTPYFFEARSILAIPIPYQGRAIGVLTVSHDSPGAFTAEHVGALQGLAESAAKHLRRAQLYRASQTGNQKPFLIKGMSKSWLEVEKRLEHVSSTSAPVLIHGESGTGKDLVANAIHFNSPRAAKSLITVNCAAIPETMLESILFGHVKGAFTGATFNKIGEFEKADGGTLFLDEVGELPLQLQAKVLRAIEQGEIQPLGSNEAPKVVNVRLLCATNRDLNQMVAEKTFRDDLYYRITVMTLELPPLRTYKDNLSVLARVFIQEAAQRHEKPRPRLSPEALQTLLGYDFPGNVRELKNAMEHAVIMSDGKEINRTMLPRSFQSSKEPSSMTLDSEEASPVLPLKEMREFWLAPLERDYLNRLLNHHQGNVRGAAKDAGVNAVTLYRLMKKRDVTIQRSVLPFNEP